MIRVIHNASSGRDISRLVAQVPGLEVFPAIIHKRYPKLGCGLSHLSIIRKARRQGEPWVWVLEDDCVFTDQFDLQRWMRILRDVFLPSRHCQLLSGGTWFLEKPRRVSSYMAVGKMFYATHCIVYRHDTYDLLLQHGASKDRGIDLIPSDLGLQCGVILPFFAMQRQGWSAIEQREVDWCREFRACERKLLDLKVSA